MLGIHFFKGLNLFIIFCILIRLEIWFELFNIFQAFLNSAYKIIKVVFKIFIKNFLQYSSQNISYFSCNIFNGTVIGFKNSLPSSVQFEENLHNIPLFICILHFCLLKICGELRTINYIRMFCENFTIFCTLNILNIVMIKSEFYIFCFALITFLLNFFFA